MLNYFEENSSLMDGTYQAKFLLEVNQRGDQRRKNGEDESKKENEINFELLIVEWGKHQCLWNVALAEYDLTNFRHE